MEKALRSLFVFALVGWIGGALFYSSVVLPVLFYHFEPAKAGSIAALIFPYYYRVGSILGVLLLAVSLARAALRGGRLWLLASATVGLMVACQIYGTFSVQPKMQQLRGVDGGVAEFQRLHRLSVRLNGVVLGGGLVLVVASGWLLGPVQIED